MRTFFILKQTFVNKFSIVVSLTCTPAPLCNNAGIGTLLNIVSNELGSCECIHTHRSLLAIHDSSAQVCAATED